MAHHGVCCPCNRGSNVSITPDLHEKHYLNIASTLQPSRPADRAMCCNWPCVVLADERGRKGIKDVEAKAAAQLLHNGEKLGLAETSLYLLHALLGPHPLASAAIFAVTQANGMQVQQWLV